MDEFVFWKGLFCFYVREFFFGKELVNYLEACSPVTLYAIKRKDYESLLV